MYNHNYVRYLIEFHVTRDWFECHEIMEEMWKAETAADKRTLWLALVRIAVGLYHERRGNSRGALKMLTLVQSDAKDLNWSSIGLDKERLLLQIDQRVEKVKKAAEQSKLSDHTEVFEVMNLPISDERLLKQCKVQCLSESLEWKLEPPIWSEELIHRHSLRDRSEVIAARHAAMQQRQQ
ncbi:DUF309 domain-containing protein [Paenibacillus sp. SC116]|uniref:DUF309 domain-containing protein n=1 Tax=Paenibacillus sp. SC116 TaxID=2968986 RepID=UPI00215A487A|nr:DUF309 domain-containing protein [Paenibacillus sp. SC116]MCR8842866.1 DUF309 domain-containing protein [Paenibacillus sp. SC116]